jgi:hypothetical protein
VERDNFYYFQQALKSGCSFEYPVYLGQNTMATTAAADSTTESSPVESEFFY